MYACLFSPVRRDTISRCSLFVQFVRSKPQADHRAGNCLHTPALRFWFLNSDGDAVGLLPLGGKGHVLGRHGKTGTGLVNLFAVTPAGVQIVLPLKSTRRQDDFGIFHDEQRIRCGSGCILPACKGHGVEHRRSLRDGKRTHLHFGFSVGVLIVAIGDFHPDFIAANRGGGGNRARTLPVGNGIVGLRQGVVSRDDSCCFGSAVAFHRVATDREAHSFRPNG